LTPQTLVLSVAKKLSTPHSKGLIPLAARFADMLMLIEIYWNSSLPDPNSSQYTSLIYNSTQYQPPKWEHLSPDTTAHLFDSAYTQLQSDSSMFNQNNALMLLQLADSRIEKIEIDQERDVSPFASYPPRKNILFRHRTGTTTSPLDFNNESAGTRQWFNMIGPILKSLDGGLTMVIDEIDSSLHPTLTAEIIQMYKDPAINKLDAQLIFTSHDTSLLQHLNRDEVWFTEKDDNSATTIGPLSEYAEKYVRKGENLEAAYLRGRYGALPDIDHIEFLQSLGLIG
jgi:hypothetical protein